MDRLRLEIHNKSLELKKKIKELNNILSHLYNEERENKNKNIYFFKRNVDKVNSATKHLNNVQTESPKKSSDNSKDSEEIYRMHKQTLSNISKLQTFYREKLSEEMNREGSPEVSLLKRNLDSLRLAFDDLRRLDLASIGKVKEPKSWKFKEEEMLQNYKEELIDE